MKTFKVAFLILSLSIFALGVLDSGAQEVVVPNIFTDTQGTDSNKFPWACELANGIRYQQVFAASQFPGPIEIRSLRYRLSEGSNGFGPTRIDNVLITLSTTSATPAAISNVYADNIGPDVTVVYIGPLTIFGTSCDIGPCMFDTLINLLTPFNYDPSGGSLLLDVTIPTCGNFVNNFFDGTLDDPTTTRVFNNNFAQPDGIVDTSDPLITLFGPPVVRNIPTMSQYGLGALVLLLGIAGVVAYRRKLVNSER